MPEWLDGVAKWWKRRRRFAEEWRFHLEMAASDFEQMGLSPREARQTAKRGLGSRRTHRRAALREMAADFRGLARSFPTNRWKRGALAVPAAVLLITVLALVLDPARTRAIESLQGLLPFGSPPAVERFVPLTPSGIAPAGLAAITLWTFLMMGVAAIAARLADQNKWRLCVYAASTLLSMALLGGVCWVVALQFLLSEPWASDILQGAVLVIFVAAYLWTTYAAWRFWWRDVKRRCPLCLRVLGMPEVRGHEHNFLLDPREVESICFNGHGAVTESRWTCRFECGQPLCL